MSKWNKPNDLSSDYREDRGLTNVYPNAPTDLSNPAVLPSLQDSARSSVARTAVLEPLMNTVEEVEDFSKSRRAGQSLLDRRHLWKAGD